MTEQNPDMDRIGADMRESSTASEDSAEEISQLDEAKVTDFLSESNLDDENPKNLPWPEENESKE